MSAKNFDRISNGVTYTPQASDPASGSNGAFYYNSTTNIFRGYINGGLDSIITAASTNTLTNKTIDGGSNTLTNIGNSSTTATSNNTPSTIVARDSSGNFTAGIITATGTSSGTSFTNFVNAMNVENTNGSVNTWVAYNFLSAGTTSSSNGAIAVQTTDTINHYGLMAFGVRSAAGYLAELQITGDALTLGNSSSSAITINSITATNGGGVGTLTNLQTGYSGNHSGYLSLVINGVTHIMPYW